jgi:23S rRNA C2498 (ribose-2'-O)-methylase RlmM
MKRLSFLVAVLVAALLGFTGCGGKKSVDTSKLESSFASADAGTKSDVQKAVGLINAQDFYNAVVQLQKVSAKAKLTQEQRDTIKDVVEQLQKLIAEGASKSVEKAAGQTTKSLNDLQKKIK